MPQRGRTRGYDRAQGAVASASAVRAQALALRILGPVRLQRLFLDRQTFLRGTIPDGLAMVQVGVLNLREAGLSGSIPGAFASQTALADGDFRDNLFSGTIPNGLAIAADTVAFSRFFLENNTLAGQIPDAMLSLAGLTLFHASENALSGAIPDAVAFMTMTSFFSVAINQLSDSIPAALGNSLALQSCEIAGNKLRGALLSGLVFQPWSIAAGSSLCASFNHLAGSIPDNLQKSFDYEGVLMLSHNHFRGTIPIAFPSVLSQMYVVDLSYNELEGSFDVMALRYPWLFVQNNRLAFNLGQGSIGSACLACSGNRVEGTLSQSLISPGMCTVLRLMDMSGMGGDEAECLRGTVPRSIARAHRPDFTMSLRGHMLEGELPEMPWATLNVLAIQGNRLKAMPNFLHFQQDSLVFVQSNLMSCHVPLYSGEEVKFSLVAFGNRFRAPDLGRIPAWISSFERSGLFWITGKELSMLMFKSASAATILVGLMVKRLGWKCAGAVVLWRTATCAQGNFPALAIHILSCLAWSGLAGIGFQICMLAWDLYTCPPQLALASVCLRQNKVAHFVAILFWQTLWFDSSMQGLMSSRMESGNDSADVQPGFRWRTCFLWLLWMHMLAVLSCAVVVNQAAKCIPNLFHIRGVLLKAVDFSIGMVQSLLSGVVIPCLSSRLPGGQWSCMVANFCISCLLPMLVVLYLDRACMGYWTAWWDQCYQEAKFARIMREEVGPIFPFVVISDKEDICSPNRRASASSCMQVALLRMQELWLNKWITSGLAMAGYKLMTGSLPQSPRRVFQKLVLVWQVASLTSGLLPLVTHLLFWVALIEVVIAAVAWERGHLSVSADCDAAGSSLKISYFSSLILCMAFASGDSATTAFLGLVFAVRVLVING